MLSLPDALYLSIKGYDVLVHWQHWINMDIKGQSEHMWMIGYNYPKPLSRIAWVWYFGDIVSSLVAQLGRIYLHMAELDVRALHSRRNKVKSTLLTNRSLRLMTESAREWLGSKPLYFDIRPKLSVCMDWWVMRLSKNASTIILSHCG